MPHFCPDLSFITRTLLCLLLAAGAAAAQWEPVGTVHGPVPVQRVVDGDTIVLFSNLGPRTVRLIGIDAPELQQRDPHGSAAADWVSALLQPGTQVFVETDLGLEDIYGRLLGYVYFEDRGGEWQVGPHRVSQLNLEVVRAGWAGTLQIAPNTTYADLYEEAAAHAAEAGLGMWGAATTRPVASESMGPISIACILFNPSSPNDADEEWVSLRLATEMDTRGYYLFDEGSGVRLQLPVGVQPAGDLRIYNPGQGIWNNSGDTVYLMLGGSVVDSWEYEGRGLPEDTVICRDGTSYREPMGRRNSQDGS